MKTLLKILGFIIAICIVLASVWYFYFFKRFSTLQDNDRKTLLESLKPDTTGKGYSDEAEVLIKDDLQNINSLNNEEKAFFKKWYTFYVKFKRETLLSPSRDKYLENSRKYYKAFRCMGLYVGKIKEDYNFNFFRNEFETDDFNELSQIVQKKNFRFLSFDEIYSIQNPEMDLNQCDAFEKDLFK